MTLVQAPAAPAPATASENIAPITPSRQVRGACPHDCPDTCALLTTVENGVATRVQGNPAHALVGAPRLGARVIGAEADKF